jgi:proline iminopeptidase
MRLPVTAILATLALAVTLKAQEDTRTNPSVPGYGGLPVKEGFLDGAEGVRLFYRVVGSGGDTVLFLHGGPGNGMREGYDLEQLAERGYTIIMYDQRGTGLSDLISTPGRLTLASHVEDLEAVRRHFRLRRPSIIGLSWGSAIALHYAMSHPAATGRLVFLSPLPPTGRSFVQRFARLDSLRTPETRARLRAIDSLWAVAPDSELPGLCRESLAVTGSAYQEGGPESRPPRGDVCDYSPAVLRHRRLARIAALTAMGAVYDFTAALNRLDRPVLVVEGERSKVPLDATRHWASQARNARLLLISRAGHRTWLDRPESLVRALDRFLKGDWPDGATEIRAGQ